MSLLIMEFIQITGVSLMLRNKKNGYWFCAKCVQASDVARLEHLSDAVVCLESFAGTPMETDSTFKAYNGSNFFVFDASAFMASHHSVL